jgi:hypothetical protein
MTIQANIYHARESLAAVKAHCMASYVVVTKESLFVKYPEGFRVDGLRVSMTNGLAWACDQAMPRIERHWRGEL